MIQRSRFDIQRVSIKAPTAFQSFDSRPAPSPHAAGGSKIAVAVFLNEHGHVVERWTFSETDVRWYALQEWSESASRFKLVQVDRVPQP